MFCKAVCFILGLAIIAAKTSEELRIVGGTPTSIYNYPFVVSVVYQDQDAVVQRCAGSLISSWHVLTTAYCFDEVNLEDLKVRAGSTSSLEGGTTVAISDVIIHPDYVIEPRTADIAMIVLSDYLAITDSTRVIYIPPQQTYIPDGYPVKALGWGYDGDGSEIETLSVIDTNIIPQEQCSEAYADDEAVLIYDQVICTRTENRSMCRGDTGAPLILGDVLVGVMTYYGTCDSSTPNVFSRVDRHTGWILEHAVPPQARGALPVIVV